MQSVKAIINLLLYSNLWIALAALAMSAQTQLLLIGSIQATPLLGFTFFATLFLYALHRIIGIQKARPFLKKGRFEVITQFKSHIIAYAVLAAISAGLFFLQLPFNLQMATVAPCLIAAAYVLPFLQGKRRLRDLNYIKIFLIAAAWSWITVLLPAIELGMLWSIPMIFIALERAFFIFAIALPFDIRDLEMDRFNQVKTIPSQFGLRHTKRLAIVCLLVMALMAGINYHINVYHQGTIVAIGLSGLVTFVLIWYTDKMKHDYYFSGLIDGMMILQFLLVLAFN